MPVMFRMYVTLRQILTIDIMSIDILLTLGIEQIGRAHV